MSTTASAPCPAQTTELERRVLAHERILQALIAYMSSTEPRFVDHLRDRFVEPMKMVRHEHDYREVDDYAEEFILAIMSVVQMTKPTRAGQKAFDVAAAEPIARHEYVPHPTSLSDRIKLREMGGIWRVTVDDVFWGDFYKKDQALAAIALARLSLR